jgi:hypothetical protein
MKLIFSTQWCNHFANVMWSRYYWWITMKAWMTWTKFMFFHPIIMYPFCEDEVGLQLKWWMTKEPWMTWMLFNSNMWSHYKGEVRSKKLLGDYQGALNNLKEAMFFNQWCNHFIKTRWNQNIVEGLPKSFEGHG